MWRRATFAAPIFFYILFWMSIHDGGAHETVDLWCCIDRFVLSARVGGSTGHECNDIRGCKNQQVRKSAGTTGVYESGRATG
jgi:hypothetical protein